MKKMLLTTLALTMFLPLADYAAAKHNDNADTDEKAVVQTQTPQKSPMFKGMHQTKGQQQNMQDKSKRADKNKHDDKDKRADKDKHADKKDHGDKNKMKKQRDGKDGENQPIIYSSTILQHKMDKINENYQKALHKIAKSSFSKELRNLLSEQAAENRDLALRQLKEKMDLCAKHACERMQFQGELKHNEHAHKLIEKVDNL